MLAFTSNVFVFSFTVEPEAVSEACHFVCTVRKEKMLKAGTF